MLGAIYQLCFKFTNPAVKRFPNCLERAIYLQRTIFSNRNIMNLMNL